MQKLPYFHSLETFNYMLNFERFFIIRIYLGEKLDEHLCYT